MNEHPLVYVIVLNYNGKSDTLDCLGSLYKMDYPNFRVAVVDNGSTDGTAQAVRREYPRAEVIETGRNLMYAGGNNEGIRHALGRGARYVLLLNNDTVVDPAMLTELVRPMQADPSAGLAGPLIYYHGAGEGGRELVWYGGGIVELWAGLTAHRDIRRRDDGRYKGVEETGYVTGCAMLMSRGCIEKVGLLDTSYVLYAEDADYSMRARAAGFSLLFVPGAKLWHKVSVTAGGEFSWFKMRRKAASNLKFLARYARWYHWLTIPFFVAFRVVSFFIFGSGG